jgi:integrase/recombinase XerD
MKQVIASIRFLYAEVLDKPVPKSLYVKMKRPKTLPVVLSKEEITRLIKATQNLKHKTILLLIYSAGLRLAELLDLKIANIDSKALKIHIVQGKGKKTAMYPCRKKRWTSCVNISKPINRWNILSKARRADAIQRKAFSL